MNGNLVIILGQYHIIRRMLQLTTDSNNTVFLTSNEDFLKDILSENKSIDFWSELIAKEFERDQLISEQLRLGKNVIVEQWHIGNLAQIQSQGIKLPENTRDILFKQIKNFISTAHVFYVSTDIEKYYSKIEAKKKSKELNELSKILQDLDVSTENLNGDAIKENLEKRLNFLLGQLGMA